MAGDKNCYRCRDTHFRKREPNGCDLVCGKTGKVVDRPHEECAACSYILAIHETRIKKCDPNRSKAFRYICRTCGGAFYDLTDSYKYCPMCGREIVR